MQKVNKLHKKIMRRVYYAFAIRMATHPALAHVFIVLVAGYALTQLVFVSVVLNNISSVKVGELLPYMVRVVYQADVITLVVLGVLVFSALSLPLRLPQYQRKQHVQTA